MEKEAAADTIKNALEGKRITRHNDGGSHSDETVRAMTVKAQVDHHRQIFLLKYLR